jgi:NAD(P)-dependent dehydrogenase (short-subunit alcohol dehydrogenase family)
LGGVADVDDERALESTMELNNTSAIVTGGASGLGEATARALAQRGVKVVIADLNDTRGPEIAQEIGGAYMHCDVTNTEEVIFAIEAATTIAPLWSVVNCAGIGWPERTIGKDGEYSSAHDLDIYRKVIEINLVGTFNVCRLAATAMSHNTPDVDALRGAIVNTASVAAEDGQIGQVIGVRANCILPGLIDTPIYGTGAASDEFKARLGAGVLFPKRLGYASEFASLAVELLANSYMNAASVRIDAGIRMQPK